MYGIGHLYCVAVRLALDAEQNRRFSVGPYHRINRFDGRPHQAEISNTNRNAGGRGFDNDVRDLLRSAGLTAHQAQHQLVIRFHQAWRIDHVAAAHGFYERGNRNLRLKQFRRVGPDLELGFLAALYHNSGYSRSGD